MPGTACRGRLLGQALALRLGEATSSLLAKAGFAPVDAGLLTPVGPSVQQASAAAFTNDCSLSVHIDSPPTSTIVWGEDDEGPQGFLRATLVR